MEAIAYLGQHENGIYEIWMLDEYGDTVSAATRATAHECHIWAMEHGATDIELV